MSPVDPALPAEARPAPRIATIDGLRGLAVMGILLMNVAGFALPSGAYFNPLALGPASHVDLAIWAANFILVDGKMRALFSILFGASTLIVVRAAEASGADPFGRHAARMATLALFGLLHFYLIWAGDILLLYAIVGLFALPFAQIEPRQQIRVALMLLALQMLVGGHFLLDDIAVRAAALAPHADANAVQAWHDLAADIGIGRPAEIAQQVALYRGPWRDLVAHRLSIGLISPVFQLEFDGPETLAFMLIGMAALGSGFLSGDWPRRAYGRAAAIGFAIGLPLSAALCWLCFRSGFDTIVTFAAATLGGVVLRPVLALADAALAILWLTAGAAQSPLRRRVIAAGRMAFSNYLGTSLVMTAVFYGWGLGLFARIERAWLYAIVLGMWLLMLGWSAPWLARFRYGPLEWLWRSLARARLQSMRRTDIASVYQ